LVGSEDFIPLYQPDQGDFTGYDMKGNRLITNKSLRYRETAEATQIILRLLAIFATGIISIAVLNKMRYTPIATDAHGGLCPMPYALCPREHLMLLRKAIALITDRICERRHCTDE
jgi:hypothetical protein